MHKKICLLVWRWKWPTWLTKAVARYVPRKHNVQGCKAGLQLKNSRGNSRRGCDNLVCDPTTPLSAYRNAVCCPSAAHPELMRRSDARYTETDSCRSPKDSRTVLLRTLARSKRSREVGAMAVATQPSSLSPAPEGVSILSRRPTQAQQPASRQHQLSHSPARGACRRRRCQLGQRRLRGR